MNINHISQTVVSTEKIPLEPPAPAVAPNKVEGAQKSNTRMFGNYRQSDPSKDEKAQGGLSARELKKVAEEMNDIMDDFQTSLGFSIREELNNQVVVEIKNRETDELIKQIPAEELLAIKEKMEELTGLLFDQSV